MPQLYHAKNWQRNINGKRYGCGCKKSDDRSCVRVSRHAGYSCEGQSCRVDYSDQREQQDLKAHS